MDSQLTLLETPPLKYRLFVGVFPSVEALNVISHLQLDSRIEFRLKGKFRPRNILHVTLHEVGDYPEIPHRVIETAAEACTAAFAGQSSLEVTLNHVMSYSGRPGNLPFVLVNPNGNLPLMELHHLLITEFAKRRLADRKDYKRDPHVTLLYDRLSVPQQPVSPISWKVNEVVLILSHLGETKYDRLQSWALSE